MRAVPIQLPAIGAGPMPAETFIKIRNHMGLTQEQMAMVLCYGAKTRIAEIEADKAPVPGRVKLIMLAYASGWRPPHFGKMVNGEIKERGV